MGARARVFVVVALAGVAAAGATVGLTALTRVNEEPATTRPAACPKGPALELDLGLRTDAEAGALRRAARAYARESRSTAQRIFERFDSVEARVGAAIASWPEGTLVALRRLAAEREETAVVRLHLGIARFCAGDRRAAVGDWRAVLRLEPDSLVAVRAGDFLHPELFRSLPPFVPAFRAPAGLSDLSPARQLNALERRARGGGAREKLLYGVVLQRLGRPVSAQRQFAAAARLAPDDAEAATAAAVGRFDKDDLSAAFGRLGPLTKRFPEAATVRFHLGLTLLWIRQLKEGRRQLRLARQLEPDSPLAREADALLARLEG